MNRPPDQGLLPNAPSMQTHTTPGSVGNAAMGATASMFDRPSTFSGGAPGQGWTSLPSGTHVTPGSVGDAGAGGGGQGSNFDGAGGDDPTGGGRWTELPYQQATQSASGQPIIIRNYMTTAASQTDSGKVRKAESDTIDVPCWPNYLQLRSYLLKISQRLCLASAWGDDLEMDWIAAVWAHGATLAKLQHVPPRYVSLSRKLAVELYATMPQKVKMRVDDLNLHLSMQNNMLNGPQTLWVILDSFEYDDNLAGARSAQDLLALKWMGDTPAQMQLFLKTYMNLATSLKDAFFAEDGLRDILAGCMKDSKELSYEYQQFVRSRVGDPERTHKFLLDAIDRAIQRGNMEAAKVDKQKEMDRLLAGNAEPGLKLYSESKADKKAQQERDAMAKMSKQIGGRFQGTQQQQQQQSQQQQQQQKQ